MRASYSLQIVLRVPARVGHDYRARLCQVDAWIRQDKYGLEEDRLTETASRC